MRFPRKDDELVALAKLAAEGLRNAQKELHSPPISPEELESRVKRMQEASFAIQAWVVQGKGLQKEMDEAREAAADGLKRIFRYSEMVFRDEPLKLGGLGWGPPREKRALQPPNQVTDLRIVKEGDDWIELAWRSPKGGGKVTAYSIQQQKNDTGPWEEVGSAVGRKKVRLEGRPRGVQLEFRVVAMNAAGQSIPSGSVRAVV